MKPQTDDIEQLTESEYYQHYKLKDKKLERALERAWNNRDFEIDKYWSRATYFWALIAAAFAGYIAVMASTKIDKGFQTELAFIIICLGIVFSSSWILVNIGSKKWQENWEKHIDMLEDKITGPIYKTVLNKVSFSVSKVNIAVSVFVSSIWILLAIVQGLGIPYDDGLSISQRKSDIVIQITIFLTIAFLVILYFYSKGKKKQNQIGDGFSFNRRKINFSGRP